jgi:hypothetical protein
VISWLQDLLSKFNLCRYSLALHLDDERDLVLAAAIAALRSVGAVHKLNAVAP